MQAHAQMSGLFMLAAMLSPAFLNGGVRAEETVKLTDQLSLGKAITAENVTVWPVYSNVPAPAGQGEFITLADAQEKKLAEVRETGAPAQAPAANTAPATQQAPNPPPQQQVAQRDNNDVGQQVVRNLDNDNFNIRGEVGGQVNQLVIENKGTQSILVLAGTLVKGGKQDRQIAQDFIIPPGKTVPVDAFCVEHGRWTSNREGQATQGQFQAQKVLAFKEVRDSGQFKGDQQAVWNDVATTNTANAKAPGTGTLMATIEETDKEALARRERVQKAIAAGLAQSPTPPVGIAYAVDGKVREIRAFNDPRILKHYQDALINTIAIEADTAQRKALKDGKKIFDGTVEAKEVTAVVVEAEKNNEERAKTQAGNINALKKGAASSASKNYANEMDANDGKQPVSQSWSKH
jgi:hypothetical protein